MFPAPAPTAAVDVVVTGMGAVSPLGLDLPTTWRALRRGASVRQLIDLFDTEGCRCREGAQAPLPGVPDRKRHPSRASRLAVRAAREALAQAGLEGHADGLPLCVSTTGGAMEWGETFLRGALAGKRRAQLRAVARYQPQQQMLDLRRSLGLGMEGSSMIVGNACASGANAIGHGFDLIRSGLTDAVLVGGYEALTELIFMGFDCLQALSPDACRPFDVDRNGLMLGEGAAFLVLESGEHAREHGAQVLGRVLGYGHSTDLHHLTQPAPDGAALAAAMRRALEEASLSPEKIAYINAHGTGTPLNDGAEAAAYAEVFGAALPDIALSSTKAAIGHTLGAAGSLEAVFALCAAREGTAPPQLHNRTPLPEVAASLARASRPLPPGTPVLSVNLGFGGSNAALVLSA